MRPRASVAVLLALAGGCFERGGKRDGEAERAPAAAAVAATDGGWVVRDPDGAPDPDAVVRIALEAEPATLDPFATLDAVSARVLGGVVEGLLCAPDGGDVVGCVARGYTGTDGLRRWQFVIEARRFSDGTPVTAADVVASLQAARGVGHAAGPLGGVLDDAIAIEAVGGAAAHGGAAGSNAGSNGGAHHEVVEVRFTEGRPTRERDLTIVPIVPAAQLARPSLATAPIGTGPFVVRAWERGASITLARSAHAARPAAAAEVRFVVTADRADAIRRLVAGELDLVTQVPIDQAIATTAAHASLVRFRYTTPAYLAAVYNTRRPALAAVETRRALTMLLDRAGVARALLGGAATLTGPWLPGDPGYAADVVPIPFDRAAARALLGRARPSLELLVPAGSTTSARLADIWAADARGLVELRVVSVPFATLLARLASGDFDVAITSMSSGPDVDLASRLASDAPADQAWPGLRDATLDALLADAQTTAHEARDEVRRAIHRRVAALAPMAFIAVDTRAGLARADVGGLVGAASGPPPLERLWKRRR